MFQPIEPPFETEFIFDEKNGKSACQHIEGWDWWRLEWYLEPYDDHMSSVEWVIVQFKHRGFFELVDISPHY